MKRLPLVAALAILASGSTAIAADEAGDPVQQACAADVQKFCASVQPGGGAIQRCMRQHAFSLSRACRSAAAHRKPSTTAPPQTNAASSVPH